MKIKGSRTYNRFGAEENSHVVWRHVRLEDVSLVECRLRGVESISSGVEFGVEN